MAKKGKQIIWHKKSGKLISSKFLKPRGKKLPQKNEAADTLAPQDKFKAFAKKFKAEIRKAVYNK